MAKVSDVITICRRGLGWQVLINARLLATCPTQADARRIMEALVNAT